jgi:hypothetical protein
VRVYTGFTIRGSARGGGVAVAGSCEHDDESLVSIMAGSSRPAERL